MSKKIRFTEEEYFKTITSILMDFSTFMQEKHGVQADINNIIQFQKWVIEKHNQLKQKQNVEEHFQLDPVTEA